MTVKRKRLRRKRTETTKIFSPRFIFITRLVVISTILVFISLAAYTYYQWKQIDFIGYSRLNLVIQEKKADGSTALILMDLENNSRSELLLSSTKKVPVAYGYGHYRAEVIPELGKQENRGISLLDDSLSGWTGVDLAGTILLPSLDSYFSLTNFISSPSTFSFWEKIWLWKKIINMPSLSVTRKNVEETGLISVSEDTYVLTQSGRNQLAKEFLFSTYIASLDHQIVVVNTTKSYGLASKVSELLISRGYDVISIQDSRATLRTNEIHLEESRDFEENYLTPLSQIFKAQIHKKSNIRSQYRGDVVIFLGEDFVSYIDSSWN